MSNLSVVSKIESTNLMNFKSLLGKTSIELFYKIENDTPEKSKMIDLLFDFYVPKRLNDDTKLEALKIKELKEIQMLMNNTQDSVLDVLQNNRVNAAFVIDVIEGYQRNWNVTLLYQPEGGYLPYLYELIYGVIVDYQNEVGFSYEYDIYLARYKHTNEAIRQYAIMTPYLLCSLFIFIIPSFITLMTKEKESHIKGLLLSNGVSEFVYQLSFFVFIFFILFSGSVIQIVIGKLLGLPLLNLPGIEIIVIQYALLVILTTALTMTLSLFFESVVQATKWVTVSITISFTVTFIALSILFDPSNFSFTILFILNLYPIFSLYNSFLVLQNGLLLNQDMNIVSMFSFKNSNLNHLGIIWLIWIFDIILLCGIYAFVMFLHKKQLSIKNLFYYRRKKKLKEKAMNAESLLMEESNEQDSTERISTTLSLTETEQQLLSQFSQHPSMEDLNDISMEDDENRDCLIIDNLHKLYVDPQKAFYALKGVHMNFKSGRIYGLLGPNGAGKSTLMNILSGMIEKDLGTITLNGELNGHKSCFSVCPQSNVTWDIFTVSQNIKIFSWLKGIFPNKSHVSHVLSLLNIAEYKNRAVKKCSGGTQRKLCVSLAFMGDSKIICLDEPSTGLDPASRHLLWDFIRSQASSENSKIILLSTHSMNEAENLCNHISMLLNGKIRCSGTSQQLKSDFGDGYQVSIKALKSVVYHSFTQRFPLSKMLHPGETVHFILPRDANYSLKDVFQFYTDHQHQIATFHATQSTLEKVFVKLSKFVH